MKTGLDITITKLSHLEQIVKSLRRTAGRKDMDISFEYICSSCFPTVWRNVQDEMTKNYIKGYNDCEEKLLGREQNNDRVN